MIEPFRKDRQRVIALAKRKGFARGKEFPLAPRKTFFLPRWVFAFYFFVYVVGCMFFLPRLVFIFYVFLFSSFCLCFWGIIKGFSPLLFGYKGGEAPLRKAFSSSVSLCSFFSFLLLGGYKGGEAPIIDYCRLQDRRN